MLDIVLWCNRTLKIINTVDEMVHILLDARQGSLQDNTLHPERVCHMQCSHVDFHQHREVLNTIFNSK